MKKVALYAVAAAAMMCATSAGAITYVADRAVGSGSVNLSITTDDTIGALNSSNIVDWKIVVTQGSDVFSIEGPGGANNSQRLISFGLSATTTNLLFNFASGGYALFQAPFIGSGQTFWCVQSGSCFDSAGPAEGLLASGNFSNYTRQVYSGTQVIASVSGATGAVPEPATWALMIGGFGLAGAALRRRRSLAVFAA